MLRFKIIPGAVACASSLDAACLWVLVAGYPVTAICAIPVAVLRPGMKPAWTWVTSTAAAAATA